MIVVIGMLCVSLCAQYSVLFTFLMATTFFITTALIVVSSLFSEKSATLLSQTVFVFVYDAFAFLLLFSSSVVALSHASPLISSSYRNTILATGSFVLINSVLYAASAVKTYVKYRDS